MRLKLKFMYFNVSRTIFTKFNAGEVTSKKLQPGFFAL